jgi:hypothetical protein
VYARTKYEGYLIAWQVFEQRALPLVVIYPAVVLGPGDYKSTGQYIQNIISRKLPITAFAKSIITFIADLIKRPPLWGLSRDLSFANIHGFICEGSKTARELGLSYTPIQVALEEAIASYQS